MKDDIELLLNNILIIISKHLDLKKYRVFLFGSRATHKAHSRSDIDIGIEGNEPIPFDILSRIREEVDNLPTLYSIDIVDFKRVSREFYEFAMQNIKILNDDKTGTP